MRLPGFFFGPSLVLALPPRDLAGLFGNQLTHDLGTTSTSAGTTSKITAHTSTSTGSTSSALVTVVATALNLPTPAPTPTPTLSLDLPEVPPTAPEEATQWKVIGIGIITVGLIATVILSIIFFDAWWNFVCDLLCGCGKKRRRLQGEENMVPDWETRDWELKLANEDGHRYPTMSSLADITDGQGKRAIELVPVQPGVSVSPKADFDPVARRP